MTLKSTPIGLLAGAEKLAEVVTVNTGDDKEALETGARLEEQSRV